MNDQSEVKFIEGSLTGINVIHTKKVMADIKGIFRDEEGRNLVPPQTVIYEVDAYQPVKVGTEGGLFFGTTRIYSGQVGDEYFMTRGHFHELANRSEFYWGINGSGSLILMDQSRSVRIEKMEPGSLHYIPAYTAHRVANTGEGVLSFGACWPADAGYNYAEIENYGFGGYLINVEGVPKLITLK
ncbi:MAG: glucose-6-phosphate isomerase family protein [Ginsengibacter sp.]